MSETGSYLDTGHLRHDLKERSARGGLVTATAQGVKFLLQTLSTIVLARLLTPQDYGLFGMVAAITNFLLLFKDLGLSAATIQKEELTHEQVSVLFWVNVLVSVGLMVLTVMAAPVVAHFYGERKLTWITVALAGSFVLRGLTVQHHALLSRQMRFGALASIEIATLFGGILPAIMAAKAGTGYWALVVLQWGMCLVNCAAVWHVCRWRPGKWRRGVGARQMMMFGGHMTGVEMLGYLGRNLDQILIGRFVGTEALGFYSRAYALLLLPLQQISGPVSAVAVPALSRLKGDHERYRRAFLSMLEKVAMVAMPVIAWMIATSDLLVRTLLGEQWQECARIFAVLGLLAFAQILSNAALWVFVSQGEGKRLLKWSAINTVLVAVAVVSGLPWGAWGVAASYSLTGMFIRTPYLLYSAGKIPPIKTLDYYRVIWPFVWVAAISYLVSAGSRVLLHGSAPWVALLTTFVLAISFSLTLIWLIPYGRRTLLETVQIVRRVLSK